MTEPSPTPKSSGPPSLKKSSTSKQTSIAGFFQKVAPGPTNASALPVRQTPKRKAKRSTEGSDQSLTPAPSSDPIDHEKEADETDGQVISSAGGNMAEPKTTGLPSPVTPAIAKPIAKDSALGPASSFYSPSRKVTREQSRDLCTLLTDENTSRPRRLSHM